LARVINGTEKLAIGPSGDQSHVHTTPGLSIRTETPLHKETNTKHLTTEIKHFSNGLKAVLLFTLTCFTAEIEINASFFSTNRLLVQSLAFSSSLSEFILYIHSDSDVNP